MINPIHTKIDTKTEDLPIPIMLDHIVKRVAQMQLSHREISILRESECEDLPNNLLEYINSAYDELDNFLDLCDEHYDIRKNRYTPDTSCYSELSDNNGMLISTFLSINNTISEYDITRMRISLYHSILN